MLDPEVRSVLDGKPIAHVATVAADGAPHVTPVWIGVHDERVVFFTGPDSVKARHLRRDPRVAVSIAPADNPFPPVIIRGRVVEWIDGDDGWAIVDAVAMKYIGSAYPREQVRVAAVIEPERQKVGMG